MALRTRLALILAAGAVVGLSGPLTARQQAPERPRAIRPDFDIRERRPPAEGSARARAELRRQSFPRRRGSRLNPHTGALRVLDAPGWSGARTALPIALRNRLVGDVDRLGLDEGDLEGLTVARDYVTRSTGMRHVTFAQSFDGIPVFGGAVTVHIAATGEIVRVTSSAARGDGRRREPVVSADAAVILAAGDVDPSTPSCTASGRCRNPARGGQVRARRVPEGRHGVPRVVCHGRRPAAGLARRARARRPSPVLRPGRRCRDRRPPAAPQPRARRQRHRTSRAIGCHRGPRSAPARSDARRHRRLPSTGEPRAPRPRHALPGRTECPVGLWSAVGQQRPGLARQYIDRGRVRHIRRFSLGVRLSLQFRRCGRNGTVLLAQLRA